MIAHPAGNVAATIAQSTSSRSSVIRIKGGRPAAPDRALSRLAYRASLSRASETALTFMSPLIAATSIAANLDELRARIGKATAASGRPQGSVKLVAVSKTHDIAAVHEALAEGQTTFGENRVQEAVEKFSSIRTNHAGIQLHLIGPLQTNKVRDALALFDVIHTLDRESLAEALSKESKRAGRQPRLFVQVNTGEEPQKAGVAPAEALAFVARCRDVWRLSIDGLMCIPPVEDEPAPHFALLLKLARKAHLQELSMGMSGDFEQAISLGATLVRVGSAIFGERPTASHQTGQQ